MMDAAEAALVELGVPAERVHTERFDMVSACATSS
jgi:ferredoxin-NADP reductase